MTFSRFLTFCQNLKTVKFSLNLVPWFITFATTEEDSSGVVWRGSGEWGVGERDGAGRRRDGGKKFCFLPNQKSFSLPIFANCGN